MERCDLWNPAGISFGSSALRNIVIFINDLPDTIDSYVYMFADDTKIFNIIQTTDHMHKLQEDLGKLASWSNRWLLRFQPDKCKHMHVGNLNPDENFRYTLMGSDLETVDEEKDIGVIIDNDLSFEKHIYEKVKKATAMFATIRRILLSL